MMICQLYRLHDIKVLPENWLGLGLSYLKLANGSYSRAALPIT